MSGKRLQSDSEPRKKSALPLILAILFSVVILGYGGLCFWVSTSDTILPNITVAGIDVGSMTQSDAKTKLDQKTAQIDFSAISVSLTYGVWKEEVSAEAFQNTSAASALAAYNVGRASDTFLTHGFQYLRHLFGASTNLPFAAADDMAALNERIYQVATAAEREFRSGADSAWTISGDTLFLTKGLPVLAVDKNQIATDIQRSLEQAIADCVSGSQTLPYTLPVPLTGEELPADSVDLNTIRNQVHTEAKSATLNKETLEIEDDVVGLDFDVSSATLAYNAAKNGEVIEIPLSVTTPEITKADLQRMLFADVLGEGLSTISGTANRIYNVKRSAEACNGVILLPGEEFSYNNIAGSPEVSAGYLEASAYVKGKTEDVLGGGICQTSSTMYYALLHTTIEIVERTRHMYAVEYVPDGMDATVYFYSLDFRFRNNTEYPIKIVAEIVPVNGVSKLSVKIMGTKTDDITIVPERVRSDFVTPPTEYVPDPEVPLGTTVREQTAYTGRKATVYCHYYDANGKLIETKTIGTDTYRGRPEIIHFNPADAASLGLDSEGLPLGDAATPPPAEPVNPTQPQLPLAPPVTQTETPSTTEPPVSEPPAQDDTSSQDSNTSDAEADSNDPNDSALSDQWPIVP